MVDKELTTTEVQEMIEQKTVTMYQNVQSVQEELGKLEATGIGTDQKVNIILTGQHQIKKLTIDPSLLLAKSPKVVADSIIAAYGDAKNKIEELVKQKMVEMAEAIGFFNADK